MRVNFLGKVFQLKTTLTDFLHLVLQIICIQFSALSAINPVKDNSSGRYIGQAREPELAKTLSYLSMVLLEISFHQNFRLISWIEMVMEFVKKPALWVHSGNEKKKSLQ